MVRFPNYDSITVTIIFDLPHQTALKTDSSIVLMLSFPLCDTQIGQDYFNPTRIYNIQGQTHTHTLMPCHGDKSNAETCGWGHIPADPEFGEWSDMTQFAPEVVLTWSQHTEILDSLYPLMVETVGIWRCPTRTFCNVLILRTSQKRIWNMSQHYPVPGCSRYHGMFCCYAFCRPEKSTHSTHGCRSMLCWFYGPPGCLTSGGWLGAKGCEELKMMCVCVCVFKSLDFDITQDGTDFNGAPPRNKDTSGTWILWMEISLPEKAEQYQTRQR